MADPTTAFEAFKACLDQIPAPGSRVYTVIKDFQPLIAAAIALIAGSAVWFKLMDDRRLAKAADRDKKAALYWRTHTEAEIASKSSAAALKTKIDKWIKDNPDENAKADAFTKMQWQQDAKQLAAEEYDVALEQLSIFPVKAFSAIRMLSGYNQNLRIFASDAMVPKHTASYISYLLTDVIKYSDELTKALAQDVANYTWQDSKGR